MPALRTERDGRRASPKTEQVVAALREQIVSGAWGPGVQLPTWIDLESSFKVGRTTLTRAMGLLKRDGFVFADATRGTYVASKPPHLYRYALAFRGTPGTPGWNPFWWALSKQALLVEQLGSVQLVPVYGVAGKESPSHHRLIAEVEHDRFAGIIFVGWPPEIAEDLLDHPWLAKVAICGDHRLASLPHVYPDRSAFVRRSLEHARATGRRRVAVVTDGHPAHAEYDSLLGDYGLGGKPSLRVGANGDDPDSAGRIVQLLLNQREEDRPDTLILTNDHLLESALGGLMASGVKVPQDLMVISHCNWPNEGKLGLPLVRLGFDAGEILDAAIREAERQRLGEEPTPFTAVSPIFDFELPRRGTSLSSPSL